MEFVFPECAVVVAGSALVESSSADMTGTMVTTMDGAGGRCAVVGATEADSALDVVFLALA